MEIRAADFVVYEVDDMARATAFYRDVLGLKRGEVVDSSWAEFDVPPTTLALWAPRATGLDRAAIPGGTIALAVPDIDAAMAELKEKGVEFLTDKIEVEVCWSAYFKDTEGNSLGLHTRKDGTFG